MITCPENVEVISPSNQPIVVTFDAPHATDDSGFVNVDVNPQSGSTFNVGDNVVTATASDASGNSATCTFTVTVRRKKLIIINGH